jgi:hypothetical protein
MTDITIHTRAGIAARISGWVGRRQRDVSDRVHAAGDAVARQHGWTVTATTGRFGFGVRIYRDPRFDDRRQQLSLRRQAAAVPPVRRRSGRPKIRRACD